MITKGTEQYSEAIKMANKIRRISTYERWNNNTLFNLYIEDFAEFISKIENLKIFASQIAETIQKSINFNGFKIANCSSKQAWIIACAAIENNINID